ncbi:hypothetical protein BDV97DRAFT_307631 [Delphinella strobiligena]|nr:hypothetical protein BDV97DRAFT_307631 [Delphinella strobiligena]
MSKASFFLVSLPTSISPSNDRDEALTALRSTVTTDNGDTSPFAIPSFKIGTLDALVQQADDLGKLSNGCEAVVGKVADSLNSLLEGDADKISQQKTVNDKPVEHYLASFTWNKVKYRAEKPISELIDILQKEIASIDSDIKSKFNQYNTTKTNLASQQRSRTGNLSQRSLASIVNPRELLAPDASEYLQQHLLAIPNNLVKDYLKTYESLTQMVVPRSSTELAKDDEFTLFAVIVFKKFSPDFVHKCREKRWIPREWKFTEGGAEAEAKELDKLEKEERRVWGEALRLSRTGYSDAVMAWIHVLALRVFVETVLRYGLPLSFACGLVKTDPKRGKKAKANLDAAYSHLGGNAFGKDKKGRVTKDDSAMSTEIQSIGGSNAENYNAYVFYEFEIA